MKKTPAIEPGSGERNKRPDKSSPDTALDLQHQVLMLPQRGLVTVLDGAERDIPNGHLRTVVDDGLSQLNPSAVSEIVRLGQEAMARKRRAWDDWLAIAAALEVGRTDLMRALHTNHAHGRRYEKAMGEWLIAHGFKEINKSTRSRMLECLKHKVEIQAWRSRLTDAERFAFSHPDTVLRKWKASTVVPDPNAPLRISRTQKIKDELFAVTEERDRYKREYERGGGDLWSAEDRAQDIAKVILGKLTKRKAETVARAILKMVSSAP